MPFSMRIPHPVLNVLRPIVESRSGSNTPPKSVLIERTEEHFGSQNTWVAVATDYVTIVAVHFVGYLNNKPIDNGERFVINGDRLKKLTSRGLWSTYCLQRGKKIRLQPATDMHGEGPADDSYEQPYCPDIGWPTRAPNYSWQEMMPTRFVEKTTAANTMMYTQVEAPIPVAPAFSVNPKAVTMVMEVCRRLKLRTTFVVPDRPSTAIGIQGVPDYGITDNSINRVEAAIMPIAATMIDPIDGSNPAVSVVK